MRNQLLKAIRDAFPDARVATYYNTQEENLSIVILKGHMYTVFRPDAALWDSKFTPAIAEQIIEEIRQIQTYDVDPFYEEEVKEEGSRGI